MQATRISRRSVRIVLCVVAAVLLGGNALLCAAEPDDLAKEIAKNLSSVKRRIVTEPSRAEKELLEAGKLLGQLKAAAPNHGKLAALLKSADDLTTKLEKRLGRPVGGSAAKEETKPATPAKPATPSNLPSSVVSRLDRIKSALDAVAPALEKNQLQTAETKLSQAVKLMEEIQKRYASKVPAGDAQMKAATERLAAISATVTQARSAADARAAAEAEVKRQREAQSKEWIAKFSPFFTSSSGQYLLIGSAFHGGSEAEQEKSRQAFAKANDLMAEYQKTEFPHGKTGELTFMEQRLAGRLKIHNEQAARVRQEEACRPWVEKLRPFVDVGAGARKYLTSGVTLGEADLNERMALLEEARALWPEYTKAEFPLGKTDQLLQLQEKMRKRLEEMPEELRRSQVLISGNVEKEFDRVLDYLAKDTGWKDDPTKKPNIVMERDVIPLAKAVERYAGTVDADDAKLATLKQKLAQVKEQDQKNRAVRAERTFMGPDRFADEGAEALRQKVGAIVKENSASARILRVTLPAENWHEESVLEWTDTTRTELRHRITRFMTAQAAAKAPDGKVHLHGVHLASDRQSDGSWGLLKGHIMWSDWMAEQNVEKESPTQ